jgi:hypothetical protein
MRKLELRLLPAAANRIHHNAPCSQTAVRCTFPKPTECCLALAATVRSVVFVLSCHERGAHLRGAANIIWKHGVNALPQEQQKSGKGRVSIILWGQVSNVVEEAGAPPMVPAQSHGGYK